ncbi:MAG: hypothetical protein V1816_12840 [Pseudomonadota bacterium]
MSKVIELAAFAHNRAVERARRNWVKKFPDKLTASTKLGDLSDRTLITMARLGEEMMTVIYELVMAVLDLGPGGKFEFLPTEPKLKVLDASLFLIDQLRWECLARLGWIHGFAAEKHPIVELVLDFEKIRKNFTPRFPSLVESHPNYPEFRFRQNIDGEAMIRSMIPAALAALGVRSSV